MYTCLICGKSFKSLQGLNLYQTIVCKYNKKRSDLDKLPFHTVAEFKVTLIGLIHQKLSLNFKSMGKQTLIVPCLESLFYLIFSGHIHYYSKRTSKYKCIFHGDTVYQRLAKIFNNPNWGRKFYNQNQQTYIVCKDSDRFVNIIEHNKEEEINPLEILTQNNSSVNQLSNKSKKSRVLQEEFLVEWKKNKLKKLIVIAIV
ncbi:41267_t:CDS:1 [Gigaspora margarita]|uniref:41267_t:CDS:1 n=1 Tax=Gigaspora margarita TaxID=4874 RepID=A0ABN7UBA4_GIGMA|nr:41267_t:CDS:1 [Gigaspora margarita]